MPNPSKPSKKILVDKKSKRKTLKKVAQLSAYTYNDIEHQMLELQLLVTKLTKKKTNTMIFKTHITHRRLYDEDFFDLLQYIKGIF